MESSHQGKTSSNQKKAIEELVQGRECAKLLGELLRKSRGVDGSATVEYLVLKILNSFSNTVSILNSAACSGPSGFKPFVKPDSLCSNAPKLESPKDGSRSISMLKDRRGRYKRRITLQTYSKETSALVDDGHAWRKYGQKAILDAKSPRHYFRCTYKCDQGCQAAKRVQKIQDDPPVYRTTYIGQHTCQPYPNVCEQILASSSRQAAKQVQKIQEDPPVCRTTYIGQQTCQPFPNFSEQILASSSCQAAKQVQKIQEDPPVCRTTYIGQHTCQPFPNVSEQILASSPGNSPFLLSFESSLTNKQNHPFLSSYLPEKEEDKEAIPSDVMVPNQSSSFNYLEAPDHSAT